MSIKTNKSFSKRIKVTGTGKLLARQGGKNHFNAKESRNTQMKGKKLTTFRLKNKPGSHLMAGSK
jgi:ribosomal protein L35